MLLQIAGTIACKPLALWLERAILANWKDHESPLCESSGTAPFLPLREQHLSHKQLRGRERELENRCMKVHASAIVHTSCFFFPQMLFNNNNIGPNEWLETKDLAQH